MKRKICALLAALTVTLAAFSGCSSSSKADKSNGSGADGHSSAEASTVQEVTDSPVKATGGKVHIDDSLLGEIWITELEGVALNKLDNKAFTYDDSFTYYSENGKPASLEGIDVSFNNGEIDWGKVKDSGIDFVMVRLGGRGYGDSGELYTDERAAEYIKDAQSAGLKVGGYFFSQATSNDEAVEEAEYAAKILGDLKLDFPLAYDWEIIKDDYARTDSVSAAQATESAKSFCDKVRELGYTPMIYSPSRELYFKYDLARLSDIDIWYCEYSDVPTFYYEFSMWQYSDSGKVDGIDGEVDLNVCFTGVADYA